VKITKAGESQLLTAAALVLREQAQYVAELETDLEDALYHLAQREQELDELHAQVADLEQQHVQWEDAHA
jgi:hypothetical protein